jgi:hypothetical protein
VIAHITGKLATRRRTRLLEAIDRATVPNYDDPGMQASFQKVLNTLTTGDNGYSLEEINRFADECEPVDKVYWLPNALSEWRNKSKKGQTPNGKPNGQPTKPGRPNITIPGGHRDYDAEARALYARALAELDQQKRDAAQPTMP